MNCKSALSGFEKAKIVALTFKDFQKELLKNFKRTPEVILDLLWLKPNYGAKKSPGRAQKLSKWAIRDIIERISGNKTTLVKWQYDKLKAVSKITFPE